MKRLPTLLVLFTDLLLASAVMAGPVEPERAATVAQNFWASVTPPTKYASVLTDRSHEWAYHGIYLFTNVDGGFVLVAANDEAMPILGYSPNGRLDPDHLPPALAEWLQGYQQQLDAIESTDNQPTTRFATVWQTLTQGTLPAATKGTSVAPLLSTRWDQTAPYNDLCPDGTVTGCAATAQAQLMKYWNYPAFGIGSHSYNWQNSVTLSADFSHTLYDWSHMPDAPSAASPTAERTAVATLMHHVGVSLDMDYGTAAQGGSAALGIVGMPGYASIDNSLKDYFGYSPSMQAVFKDYGYSDDTWRSLLKAELDAGRPVVYGGHATQGGHGFVCDGYDERGYMHFNFGWSGVGDGYYPVDSISPGVGGVGGNVTYTFNQNNSALLGVVPDYRMRLSDTLFGFTRDGGTDSVLFAVDDQVDATWSVASSADWLTVSHSAFAHAGWVHLHVDPNSQPGERAAWLTFTQGTDSLRLKVVQTNYDSSEMCPLQVVMQATYGDGWQGGACLTLESREGYVFGTATLASGSEGMATITVAPHDVVAVWHPGGGTDRYINYYIRNQYGEEVVTVDYAYRNGGTHHLEWPCAHLDADRPQTAATEWNVRPNPASGLVTVDAEGLLRVELLDVSGRRVLTTTCNTLDVSALPAGPYFVRITTDSHTSVKRIVKK
ncbi:MAG: C10 family peptidase [Bacteroidales bacterium]|nr:C10 family peptidase [Bacteroidales bacterium]